MQPQSLPPSNTIYVSPEYKGILPRAISDQTRVRIEAGDGVEAYVISPQELEQWEQIRAKAKNELFSMMRDMQQKAARHSPEEIEEAIAEALAASRTHDP